MLQQQQEADRYSVKHHMEKFFLFRHEGFLRFVNYILTATTVKLIRLELCMHAYMLGQPLKNSNE